MADGAAELSFAIDCGARVPFTLTSGRLASVEVTATLPPMRSGGGGTTISRELFPLLYSYPYERSVGDVTVHFDGPRTGWICRIAGVDVVPDRLSHFYPGDSAELTATLSGCHAAACLGCSWIGGAGLQFSDPQSLSTTVTYDPDVCDEPQLGFSLGCQEVFFLNDADFLEGECTSNRPERIRPVTLNLTGPLGTNGTARLSVQGGVDPVMFHIVNGVTNRVTAETEFPLAVTNDFEHTGSYTVYVSCPNLGTGTITATTFRCIEPLRKLVTTEKMNGRYVNPSRLVMWTNAVLKVGANGPFSPSEVNWRVVSGPARITAVDGWCVTVEPTGTDTNVVVEARFNDDEIQPRFVMPVVMPRTIPVKAFIVQPPENGYLDVTPDVNNANAAWTDQEIYKQIDTANKIFTQVGIEFELEGPPTTVGTTNDWNLTLGTSEVDEGGRKKWRYSSACTNLLSGYTASDCIEIYFTGSILYRRDSVAANTPYGIVVGKRSVRSTTLAHELGHALGLNDCYVRMNKSAGILVSVGGVEEPVDGLFFVNGTGDWGRECGRGFYGIDDSKLEVANRLLMNGYSSEAKADIPTGRVLSLTRDSDKGTPELFRSKVGESHIRKRNKEVYSR